MLRMLPIVAAAVLLLPTRAPADGRYFVTDIKSAVAPVDGASAWRINSWGQVSGTQPVPFGIEAFLWTPTSPNGVTGSMALLGDLPNGLPFSSGTGINSSGQVVGKGSAVTGDRAFLWTPSAPNATSGSLVDLGDLPTGIDDSIAYAINEWGQVVGESDHDYRPGAGRAFLWTPDTSNGSTGSMVDLGTLGGEHSIARDINSRGQIVGSSDTGRRLPQHAFLWVPEILNGTSGAMVSLGDLPGGLNRSAARGINSVGQVVGDGEAEGGQRAFLWSPNSHNGTSGSMIDLGVLSGHENSVANDVNLDGFVVGTSRGSGELVAFVWIPDESNGNLGSMHDLNDLMDPVSGTGWTLQQARGINDFGQIVGVGVYDPDGPGGEFPLKRSFLLTPIPVPEAPFTGMIGIAFAAVIATRINRRAGTGC